MSQLRDEPKDNFDGLSMEVVINHATNREAWGALYDEVEPSLEFAKRLLSLELDAFLNESGKDIAPFTSIRIKCKQSFVNKMIRMASDPKKLRKKYKEYDKSKTLPTIFDLISDMIGVRMIFNFEREILQALRFWITYPAYCPVELLHYLEDATGFDSDILGNSWLMDISGAQKAPKESGYESLHLVSKLSVPILIARYEQWHTKVSRASGKKVSSFDWGRLCEEFGPSLDGSFWSLEHLCFEIQFRTMLEHAWAEAEHRFAYAPVKAGTGLSGPANENARAFRNYKAILRAAQMHQNSIRTGFVRWDSRDDAMVGRSASVKMGVRAEFWSASMRERIMSADAAVCKAIDESNVKTWRAAMSQLKEAVHFAKIEEEGTCHIGTDIDRDQYCRNRTLVLLLGAVLGNAWLSGANQQDQRELSNFRNLATKMYVEDNLPLSAGLLSPRLVAVRIYEHIRILDEWFTETKEGPNDQHAGILRDPIVLSRAASVHFRHFGSFRRARSLLTEGIGILGSWKFDGMNRPEPLTTPHFLFRSAQSSWAAYHLEGRQRSDLTRGLGDIQSAIEANPKASKTLTGKLISLGLAIALYETSTTDRGGRISGSEDGWRTLLALTTRSTWLMGPADLWRKDRKEQKGQGRMSSLQLQGAAVATAIYASHEKDAREQGRILVDARLLARKGRLEIQERMLQKGGGALQFHLDVALEIEGFVYSLCSIEPSRSIAPKAGKPRTGKEEKQLPTRSP